MNTNELESLTWLYFDGEISETELVRLRRALATNRENRATYARLHRLHLATVVAVCGRTVDLRQVPPNLLTLVDTEAAPGPDARKIVAFAASFGALAACAALAFVAFNGKTETAPENNVIATVVTPAPVVSTTLAPTPAPSEIVGRYAPTSPSAIALSESTKAGDALATTDTDTFSFGTFTRRSSAFGQRNQDAAGFGLTQVGNDSETSPTVSPAILTEDYFQNDQELLGAPKDSSNLPNQPLIIR